MRFIKRSLIIISWLLTVEEKDILSESVFLRSGKYRSLTIMDSGLCVLPCPHNLVVFFFFPEIE